MDEHSKKIARVLAKAWVDPAYHARLSADPKAVLHEAGVSTSHKVMLHEDNADVSHFVIPRRPAGLHDEDLKKNEPHPDLCCTACACI